MPDQKKRVALVTGTSTGFGKLIALDLAKAGYHVYATMRETGGRNAAPASELTAKGIVVLDVDVTSETDVARAAERVASDGHVLDVLVNNAGIAMMGVSEAVSTDAVRRMFETNVFAPVTVNRAFLPAMRAAGRGLVVAISSVAGRVVFPFNGIYTGSKFALEAMTESLSYELRPHGVDVAIVEPGAFATNIVNVAGEPDDGPRAESYGPGARAMIDGLKDALKSRAGNAQDVADAVLRLAEMPQGSRPLRTVVGGLPQVNDLNAASANAQRSLLESTGFAALLAPEPAAR